MVVMLSTLKARISPAVITTVQSVKVMSLDFTAVVIVGGAEAVILSALSGGKFV